MAVSWMWSGGVTPTGATVVAKLGAAAAAARLVISTASDLSSPAYSASVAPDANDYVRLTAPTLVADTQYHYAVELDASVDALRGKLKTPPVAGSPASFSIAVMGDEYHNSNHRAYDTIRAKAPLLNVFMGDFGYPDIGTNDQAAFRSNYETVMGLSRVAQLFREHPIDYAWSDHDFGVNDSDGTSASRPAAANVYRQVVPHHTLPAGTGDNAIYHAFTIGRVRFIYTDQRWARDPNNATDTPTKTMLGATQLAWFKAELLAAQADPDVALIVWLNDVPWIALTSIVDSWGKYTYERQAIADHIKTYAIDKLIMVSGDTHAAMYDDGTNSGYATGGGGSFPVFHVGGVDCIQNSRGGPYSSGVAVPVSAGYSMLTVEDTAVGTPIVVRWRSWTVNPSTGVETEIHSYQFRRPEGWASRFARAA